MKMNEKHEKTPIETLDPTVVGTILINLVLGSSHMGHKNLKGTLDYIQYDPNEEPEMDFIYDVLKKKVPEVINKWVGSSAKAGFIVTRNLLE